MAITSAFQADDVGSTPTGRSNLILGLLSYQSNKSTLNYLNPYKIIY